VRGAEAAQRQPIATKNGGEIKLVARLKTRLFFRYADHESEMTCKKA
jgi:hypothetical protein